MMQFHCWGEKLKNFLFSSLYNVYLFQTVFRRLTCLCLFIHCRYAKEEPFSVISVDIRNHSNLLDSMEQYVKGELLEGADSYHCDKCDKKVVTVKRLCVKKLPPVLAIQLKRFEYDFDRVCAIKFNDYFEFPRNFDMEPYTGKILSINIIIIRI